MKVVIIGGGAAGFFAAITFAEKNTGAETLILERGNAVLQKVKISGGGRCNVTNACFEPPDLVRNYPRGTRELTGPFSRFGPRDTVQWFEQRGTRLKAEADGRMFPVSDSSQSIIDCLWQSAAKAGVQVLTGSRVEVLVALPDGTWRVEIGNKPAIIAQKVLVASGSSEAIWELLSTLGHTIVPPVPSLFTFNTKDPRLRDLAGVAVSSAMVEIVGLKPVAQGPVLVTHWGLSGPGILRLSAWAARELHDKKYHFTLKINWTGAKSLDEVTAALQELKTDLAKKQVLSHAQLGLPTRLWQSLATAAGVLPDQRWADLNKKTIIKFAQELGAGEFAINGKSTFKEEFVTAGGVDLKEVNFKTFESKRFPGLYFAGEVLNIDAITGGFNFQAAWTGGWIAGNAMADFLNQDL